MRGDRRRLAEHRVVTETDACVTPSLPDQRDTIDYIRSLSKPTVAEVLRVAAVQGQVAIQPRCGVGGHDEMIALLVALETGARPDVLTLTIDSHTRLNHFDRASQVLASAPANLNGYPLVSHGWQRGREINHQVGVPIEVRHGSPRPQALFEVSLSAGFTSFEGGGISYNIPYSKNVPLAESLAAYRYVDARCGELARAGIIVDRELFGTLTAVLVPPSIGLAISVIEAVSAAQHGVRCISVSYPQGGNLTQDIAALRAVPALAAKYLPPDVEVYPVLHEFMGVFPRSRVRAEQLIFYGALVARLGGAAKLITKTCQEAYGIPDAESNASAMRLARLANSTLLDFVTVPQDAVAEEQHWIEREVADLVEPIVQTDDLDRAVVAAFRRGSLDVPFSASVHAHSAVLPRRDATGAIRYFDLGGLPFGATIRRRNEQLLAHCRDADPGGLVQGLTADINYFLEAPEESDFDFVSSPVTVAGRQRADRP